MVEDRKTFTVPDGYEAIRDSEGRATGEIRLTYATLEAKLAEVTKERDEARKTLRAVRRWTLFELRGNATRQPWLCRLAAIDAALTGGKDG